MNRYMTYLTITILLTFFPSSLLTTLQNKEETGTIIVTYQVDPHQLSIDRIRFWLINSQQERKPLLQSCICFRQLQRPDSKLSHGS